MTETLSYHGLCSICGAKGEFARGDVRSTRETFACTGCRANLRYRDQAALVLDEFARGRSVSLANLVASGRMADVDIFEAALKGPFVNAFKALPRYVRSYYWPDRALGEVDKSGARNEDITRLTFADGSFDLVITSDVLEHVYDYRGAFAEILRVLKPGGVHIFSIPTDWPLPDKSEPRVAVEDGVERHLKEPRYHTSGDGTPCIVYTDFGADLVDTIDAEGRSRTQVIRRHGMLDRCYVAATFLTRKLA
ncbi:MAG: class I SAM-dependent methyltransferase [Alphaproteobacteria bacterium]|nr:class I SAM-dependent methyltransferase [Alphaproteobacteria bacterium]